MSGNLINIVKSFPSSKKKSKLLAKLNLSMEKNFIEYQKEFYNTPEKYLRIDEVGDLHIQWMYNRYAALRMLKNLPIFERAYQLLTERKNYSRKTAFGEMHCDGYLWIEKHQKIKVIVEERQSYKFIFIYDGHNFHIRELAYQFNYPSDRRRSLKGITVDKFKKQGFVPYCPQDFKEKRFRAFTYGDDRDEGYVFSMTYMLEGMETSQYADRSTLYAIDSLKFWQPYLDNPSDLE